MSDQQKQETLNVKRFGYVISALCVIISNISLINTWPVTPILFLVTMYFLTGALWAASIIKPFYSFFGRPLSKRADDDQSEK